MSDIWQDFRKVEYYTYYEPTEHKTADDLCYLCLHELDLHAEGEYWHPAKVRKTLLNFINKHGSDYYKKEGMRQFNLGKGKRKEDCLSYFGN